LAGRLYVVARDASDERVAVLSIDATGSVGDSLWRVPLDFVSGVLCDPSAGLLVVAGGLPGGAPVAFGLDLDGEVRWRCDLVGSTRTRHWPRPFRSDDGRLGAVWVGESSLCVAELGDGERRCATKVPLASSTDLLAVTGARAGCLVARSAPAGTSIEVLHVVEGSVRARHEVGLDRGPKDLSLERVDGGSVLCWVDGTASSCLARQLDEHALARGETRALLRTESHLRVARLVHGAAGRTVLTWQTVARGDAPRGRPGERTRESHQQPRTVSQFIATYDGRPGEPLPVPVASVAYHGACWLEPGLVVVLHGEARPILTALRV
jgi:hypothetical protein